MLRKEGASKMGSQWRSNEIALEKFPEIIVSRSYHTVSGGIMISSKKKLNAKKRKEIISALPNSFNSYNFRVID